MENQASEAKTEKKSGGLKKYIILFIIVFIGAAAYWVYGEAEKYLDNGKLSRNKTSVKIQNNNIAASKDSGSADLPDVVVSLLPPLLADASEVANPALSADLGASAAAAAPLKQNNKIFILYLAARDLRDSIATPARFPKELAFTRVVSLDYPELQSKIEMLDIAASHGIPTQDSLLADLAVLEEKMRNKNHGSFIANVQNSLSKLIVISKIEGEVRSDDYNSIIKRAEIAVEKNDLTKAGQELAKLGTDASDVSGKISSLANMREITEYIVDFAKAKIASE